MKTLLDSNNNVLALLGEQKIDPSLKYRIMHFDVIEKINEDKFYLFNNMTKELCSLDKNEVTQFKNVNLEDKNILELAKRWFIVPQNFNEVKTFDQIRDLYLGIKDAELDNSLNSFTIVPTTDCNARCFYCYENGCKKYSMGDKTAHDVASFIKNSISSKKAHLRWFGGEPLVGANIIDLICHDLVDAGVEISSDIISNGFLFDEAMVQKAKELWNLKLTQITLDGTEDVYNKTKNYVSNDSSSPFLRVIDNIELLLKNDIRIHVRLNLTEQNREDIIQLAYFLSKRFNGFKDKKTKDNLPLLGVYVHTIFQELDDAKNNEHSEMLLKNIYDAELEIDKLLINEGLQIKSGLPRYVRVNHCMADNGCSAVILPDGGLTICEHHVGGEQNFGSIYSDKKNEKLLSSWKEKYPVEQSCFTCECYPSCMRLKNCPNSYSKCFDARKNWEIQKLHMRLKNLKA